MKKLNILFILCFLLSFHKLYAEPIKNPMITNITGSMFTVIYQSQHPVKTKILYGQDPKNLKETAYDDRGKEIVDTVHHITVKGLKPQTEYFFVILSGKQRITADENKPFRVRTGNPLIPSGSLVIYGKILRPDEKTPAKESIVCLILLKQMDQDEPKISSMLSCIVDKKGFWNIDAVNFRTLDNCCLFNPSTESDLLKIYILLGDGNFVSETIYLRDATPAETIILPEE
jgi:hypothetical protein